MISYINGTVEDINDTSFIIDVGGIGYEIFVTESCFKAYGSLKSNAKIFTYMNVKEDSISLFGFYTKQERNMFLRLLTVSGIGPKGAMTILCGMSINDFANALINANTTQISSIKGVGKKTAERIVLELKDKIAKEYGDTFRKTTTISDIIPKIEVNEEACIALMSLGYTKNEAVQVISKLDIDNLSTEEIVIKVLRG